jgi:hypothetical protein
MQTVFYLKLLSEEVVFKGQWPTLLESRGHQVRIDTKMSFQLCNYFKIVASIVKSMVQGGSKFDANIHL